MDWTTENIKADLTWFYLSAPGECGVRSIQGGFEAQMASRALTERSDGAMHIRETRSSPKLTEMPEDLDAFLLRARADMSHMAPVTRARTIYHRLAQLTEHQRRVLEAQFGCTHVLGDVSLALACMQSAATEGHVAAMRAARDRHERKFAELKSKATKTNKPPTKGGKPAEKPKAKLTGGSTVRDFLKVLCEAAEAGQVLEHIIDEARKELAAALTSYAEAGRTTA